MTHQAWQGATTSRVQGLWHLHTLHPADMDLFIGPSSVIGVADERSQARYAAGNTFINILQLPRQLMAEGSDAQLGGLPQRWLCVRKFQSPGSLKAARSDMAVAETERLDQSDCNIQDKMCLPRQPGNLRHI